MIWAFDGSSMHKVLRRLCGQVEGVPSVVFDQSIARMREPISPPPARNERLEVSVGRAAMSRSRLKFTSIWQLALLDSRAPRQDAAVRRDLLSFEPRMRQYSTPEGAFREHEPPPF